VDTTAALAQGKVDLAADTGTSRGFRRTASLRQGVAEQSVLLVHASGHAAFANGKAMELSGTAGDGESRGGEIPA